MVDRAALEAVVESYDVHTAELQTLQAFRVRSILLVASLYDSYILSEGEHLSELIFNAYHHLSLSAPPAITRVSTRERALEALRGRPFDVVITLANVGGMSASGFGQAAKQLRPEVPVFLMAYNARDLRLPEGSPAALPGVDRTFIWRGDVRLILSIIKLVEDERNAPHDSDVSGARTLVLVEDSVPFYSSYLPMLFSELVKQTEYLISEEVNLGQRMLRRRLRPKIRLACSFEEAWALYEASKSALLGVISDLRFPRNGKEDPRAGIELLRRIRRENDEVALLLQSSQQHIAPAAERLGAGFVDKNSPTLLHELRSFMLENLGFGDFVFRLPDGTEVARARDVNEMLHVLQEVPVEALRFHGSRHHFSNWLLARTEFELAAALRKLEVSDFASMEDMRGFLLETLERLHEGKRRGQVEDFDRDRFDGRSRFVRIGGGSLGGKGRGLAFIHELLSQPDVQAEVSAAMPGLRVIVPRSAVIATDGFDRFMEDGKLLAVALAEDDDRALIRRFLEAELAPGLVDDLRTYLEHVRYPLAVRSSSLLEDSHHLPAAGVYPTHMLPNNDDDLEVRLADLRRAIKHLYASTFFRAAKAYLAATPSRVEDEKMAVVLQEVIGRRHGERGRLVYPDISGVARSLNFYPVRDMRMEEGIVTGAFGLGRTVVEGERAVRFSPAHPEWLPQFSTPDEIQANAQRTFWALDLEREIDFNDPEPYANLVRLDLEAAEGHDSLWPVASVYSPANDTVYDGLGREGVPLVTFAPVLKHTAFPLAAGLTFLLELGSLGMAGPVEMEFAANVTRPDDPGGDRPVLYFLQIRPLAVGDPEEPVDLDVPDEALLLRSSQALGVGRNLGIRDVVAVRRDTFDRAKTREIAREVEQLNRQLAAAGRPYLLIGPGRWGTADRWLGVPVGWPQISGARAIVECDLDSGPVEPSQGTHFFHNLVSLGIAYFTVSEGRGDLLDWDWLTDHRPAEALTYVCRYTFETPLEIRIDAGHGEGIVLKEGAPAPAIE